jgi:hypothetical protein
MGVTAATSKTMMPNKMGILMKPALFYFPQNPQGLKTFSVPYPPLESPEISARLGAFHDIQILHPGFVRLGGMSF